MGFPLEAGQAFLVARDFFRQDLDRDVTLQHRVGRAVDLSHSTRPDRGGDLVGTEPRAGFQGHVQTSLPANRRRRNMGMARGCPDHRTR
jgi:hypothetical protein